MEGIPILPPILLKLKIANKTGMALLFSFGSLFVILGITCGLGALQVHGLLKESWGITTTTEFPLRVGLFLIPSLLLLWLGFNLLRAGIGVNSVYKHSKLIFHISGYIFCQNFFSSRKRSPKFFPSHRGRAALLCIMLPLSFALYALAAIGTFLIFATLNIPPETNSHYSFSDNFSRNAASLSVPLISLLILLFFWGLAISAHRLILRTLSIPSQTLINKDQRTPVLLLRSFSADGLKSIHPFCKLVSLTKRFEEIIALSAWRFGPVIGIGRPRERLPKLGASKEYIADEHWKNVVREKIIDAGSIVVIAGNTDGLKWELNEILNQKALSKTILIIPPLAPKKIDNKIQESLNYLHTDLMLFKNNKPNKLSKTLLLHQDHANKLHIYTSNKRFTWDYQLAFYGHSFLKNSKPHCS